MVTLHHFSAPCWLGHPCLLYLQSTYRNRSLFLFATFEHLRNDNGKNKKQCTWQSLYQQIWKAPYRTDSPLNIYSLAGVILKTLGTNTDTYFITKRPSDSYNQLPHLFILMSAAFVAYILSACLYETVHRAKVWLKCRTKAIAINVISTVAIPYVLTALHYESLHWSLQHKNVH